MRVPGLIEIYGFILFFILPVMRNPTRSATLVGPARSSALHTTGAEEEWLFLPPNSVPRNSDLPRLKSASDWLPARSACHICIKQLFDDGRGPLKETAVAFVLSFSHC